MHRECLNNVCMNDDHMTSPRGLALWWLITLDESSPQWTHGTLVPSRRKAVGRQRQKGEVTHHSNMTTDRSSDKQRKKPRDLEPLVLETPAEDKKLMLEIRSDSKTTVDWVNGHAKLKTWASIIATAQNLLRKWCCRGVDLRRRVADRAVHIFREHNREADTWAGKGVNGREEEWIGSASVV